MTATETAPQQELQEIIDLMASRGQTYGLLSRVYRVEVDKPLLDELCAMKFPVATGNEECDKGYTLWYRYLRGAWSDTVRELAIDYVRTFIGHGVNGYSAAYPFESVHTSERRLLMQEARDEVLALYRSQNLKRGHWNEGEDHIALELEFMQVLCKRTVEALEANNVDEAVNQLKIQHSFLEDHLLNWIPLLTNDMLKFAQTGFYQGLAHLTRGFLEIEAEVLPELIEESEA